VKTKKWYHCTSDKSADAILQNGFDDSNAKHTIKGIWLGDVPPEHGDLSCKDGMAAHVVLEVELPQDVVEQHNLRPDSEWGIYLPGLVLEPVSRQDLLPRLPGG